MTVPVYQRCGTEEDTFTHVLCECEALVTLRYTYLCSFFLEPWGCYKLSLGIVWNSIKGTVLPWLGQQFKKHKGPVKRCMCIGTKRAQMHLLFYSDLLYGSFVHKSKEQYKSSCMWKKSVKWRMCMFSSDVLVIRFDA